MKQIFRICLLSIVLVTLSIKTNAQAKEFMTIVAQGERCDIVWTSYNGEVKGEKLKKQAQDYYDYNPVLSKVEALTADGWEVVNSTLSFTAQKNYNDPDPLLYFLLSRNK